MSIISQIMCVPVRVNYFVIAFLLLFLKISRWNEKSYFLRRNFPKELGFPLAPGQVFLLSRRAGWGHTPPASTQPIVLRWISQILLPIAKSFASSFLILAKMLLLLTTLIRTKYSQETWSHARYQPWFQ